jgi:hypothetical protein
MPRAATQARAIVTGVASNMTQYPRRHYARLVSDNAELCKMRTRGFNDQSLPSHEQGPRAMGKQIPLLLGGLGWNAPHGRPNTASRMASVALTPFFLLSLDVRLHFGLGQSTASVTNIDPPARIDFALGRLLLPMDHVEP